jgi:hypothetical protein
MNGRLNKRQNKAKKRKKHSILEKLEKVPISIRNGRKLTPTKKKRKPTRMKKMR